MSVWCSCAHASCLDALFRRLASCKATSPPDMCILYSFYHSKWRQIKGRTCGLAKFSIYRMIIFPFKNLQVHKSVARGHARDASPPRARPNLHSFLLMLGVHWSSTALLWKQGGASTSPCHLPRITLSRICDT